MKKLLLSASAIAMAACANAQCTELFISEYVEGWSNNKALEIYNPTNATINLSGYRIARYSNGTDVPPADQSWAIALSGTIGPYGTKVLVLDKRDPLGVGNEAPVWDELDSIGSLPDNLFLCPDYSVNKAMYFNGDDAVALETSAGVIVDLIGKYGEQPVNAAGGTSTPTGGWTDVSPYSTGQGNFYTVDQTLYRKSTIQQGVTTNPTLFNPSVQWERLNANTFFNLGCHTCTCQPVPVVCQTVSVNELVIDKTTSFFPTLLSNGSFTVKATSAISSVEICNVFGQTTFAQSNYNSSEVKIELSDIKPGIYFVKANFKSGYPVTKKIVIE